MRCPFFIFQEKQTPYICFSSFMLGVLMMWDDDDFDDEFVTEGDEIDFDEAVTEPDGFQSASVIGGFLRAFIGVVFKT